jgi:septal ring factor EnvC (AmiA/AmiB activator)
MNKMPIVLCILISVVLVIVLYLVMRKPEHDNQRTIQKINELKKEIIKMDSLQRSEQRRQVDSMKQGIQATQTQLEKLDKINNKLRQQNEKMDLLYNSLNDNMPKF